jgi:hypothetical protein
MTNQPERAHMSTVEEDLFDVGELERLTAKQKAGNYQPSEAEVEAMLRDLDAIVIPTDDEPAQDRDRSEIISHIESATALAKPINDPILTWLMQTTLAHLQE